MRASVRWSMHVCISGITPVDGRVLRFSRCVNKRTTARVLACVRVHGTMNT